jgi:hypothetical protein
MKKITQPVQFFANNLSHLGNFVLTKVQNVICFGRCQSLWHQNDSLTKKQFIMQFTATIQRLVCVLLSSFILLSCKKEGPLQSLAEAKEGNPAMRSGVDGTSIQHGIMVFSTVENFQSKITELTEMRNEELDAYNSSSDEFISLYRKYQLMDNNAEAGISESASSAIERRAIADIPDSYFASLVNADGIIIVDGTIYQYLNTDDFRTVPADNLRPDGSINWAGAKLFKTSSNYGNPNWASFPPVSHFFNNASNGLAWPKSNNRPVRAVHTKWCSWYGIYVSMGSKIKMEKKTIVLGWVNINHSSASLAPIESNYRIWVNTNGAYTYLSASHNKYTSNQNVNEKVLDWYVAAMVTGPIQHQVGTFKSNASISYGGYSLNDNWIH